MIEEKGHSPHAEEKVKAVDGNYQQGLITIDENAAFQTKSG